jgi:hypothetical protein
MPQQCVVSFPLKTWHEFPWDWAAPELDGKKFYGLLSLKEISEQHTLQR